MRCAVATLALVALTTGCADTGQDRVSFPVHVAGSDEAAFERDGIAVTIDRATIGFGPLYLCATSFADTDVCPRAEAELLDAATADGLDPAPAMIGEAQAITGTVRSAMFDYGTAWLVTARRPRALEGAPAHAAIFEATLRRGDDAWTVTAELDVLPREPGASAVIGAPTGEHAITGEEALTVRFDPVRWWRAVDLEALVALDDDGDGAIALAPGDAAYETLVLALTTDPPAFEWVVPGS